MSACSTEEKEVVKSVEEVRATFREMEPEWLAALEEQKAAAAASDEAFDATRAARRAFMDATDENRLALYAKVLRAESEQSKAQDRHDRALVATEKLVHDVDTLLKAAGAAILREVPKLDEAIRGERQ